MRGEHWIVDVPPEVHAEARFSEQDVALESERLESLISVLRQRAARRERLATCEASDFESPRVRAAREMLGGRPTSD
jgi:hypothetical protein